MGLVLAIMNGGAWDKKKGNMKSKSLKEFFDESELFDFCDFCENPKGNSYSLMSETECGIITENYYCKKCAKKLIDSLDEEN